MKINLFALCFILYFTSFGQSTTKEIFSIESVEKNTKTIVFYNELISSKSNLVLKAKNITSSDYASCSWTLKLNRGEIKQFCQVLSESNLNVNSSISSKKFHVKVKKNEVKIIFSNSSCTSKHKTHYFQKSCNRELIFSLIPNQINLIIDQLNSEFFNLSAEKFD